MWNNITNVFQSAMSMLQSGEYPNGTPPQFQKVMESVNHLASKKFFITLSGFGILGLFYLSSVLILFFLPHIPEVITGFVVIFSKSIEVFAVIMSVYLSAQGIVDLKYNSNSNVSLQDLSQQISQNINENKNIAIDQEIRSLGSRKTHDFDDELEESPAENINITQNTI